MFPFVWRQKKGRKGRKARSDALQTTTTTPTGVVAPVTSAPDESNVEFINPKFRDEFASRNEGTSPNNPWVWLNAYSRIPVTMTDQLSPPMITASFHRLCPSVMNFHQSNVEAIGGAIGCQWVRIRPGCLAGILGHRSERQDRCSSPSNKSQADNSSW